MSFKTIKGIEYDVISTRRNDGYGHFDVYVSHQNKGLSVSKGTKKHKLKISFEGLKYYHLGAISASSLERDKNNKIHCVMVLKKDYKIIN